MDYSAHVIFSKGQRRTVMFDTPGKAMDYITYWVQNRYPVVYGDVIKHTAERIPRRIYHLNTGIRPFI
jgi:hypothetical protein